MSHQTGRRGFLQSGAGAGILLLRPETAFGTQANSALEVGIVGCGGRGNFIGRLFMEHADARVVALADPFRDRTEATVRALKLTGARQYVGLDAYRDLIASKLDVVAVDSPPYFHPEQVEAAVAAGRHVFLAKPVAVDVPGCRSIAASGEKAKGKCSFLVDWPTRGRPVFDEAAARIHRGDIGKLLLGHVYYHGGPNPRRSKPGMSPDEARLRDWWFDRALSGDIIVEQAVHPLDVMNWFSQAHPIQANGTGGGRANPEMGDCWGHFFVHYWYPDDLKIDFSHVQVAKGFWDICIRMYGTRGTAEAHHRGTVNITGETPWGTGAVKDDTSLQGPIVNVKTFAESIRTGKLLNNAAPSAEAALTGILGRMAAYREGVVTWDEMMRSNEKFTASLKI